MGTGRTAAASPPASRPAVDRCPGVLRLHDAGDGLLARVRVPGGRLDVLALTALADSTALGNGLAELTSRASVQIRGLAASAALPLAGVLERGGLLPSRAHDRARNVLGSPVAGRLAGSLVATDSLVSAFDRALCADPLLASLPARLLFGIDDGAGLVDLGLVDVGLVAEGGAGAAGSADAGDGALAARDDAAFRIWLDGVPTGLRCTADEAVELLVQVAHAFLAVRAELAPTAWHVGDLPDGAAALAAALGSTVASRAPHAPSVTVLKPGTVAQRDGRVALTALPPLARLEWAQLAGLAELLAAEGLADVRLAASRTVTLPDVPVAREAAVRDGLRALGLVVDADSGWRGLTACSGLGACRRALIDVRAAAAERAERRGADAPSEHWSACERRCGMKRDVPIGIVAGETTLAVRVGEQVREAADVDDALELLALGRLGADRISDRAGDAAGAERGAEPFNLNPEGPTA
ncbi:MAG TPA: hypothetical protein VGM91_20965 [Conexibacter sp.]|jgi:sulfite reductase beta subunit-like hemoprotein